MRPLSRLPISDTDMHAGYGRRIMTAEATMDRILIVDDHPLVRDGLRSVIAVTFDQCEILEAASRGLPVVGTHAAIGSLDGIFGLTAVDGAEFVAEARRMLQDPAYARSAGDELDARNREHWAEGAPQRAVAEWLA